MHSELITENKLGAEAEYLTRLNEPQRKAVETLQGAVLVLAGAGTGKTSVLTSRIAHIINSKHAYASQILAVTFTNKASREMKERVQRHLASERKISEHSEPEFDSDGYPIYNDSSHIDSLTPEDITNGMWLGTFHSIAAKILRRHAEIVGLNSNFTILDADDQLRLLKTIMNEQNIDPKLYVPKNIMATIQSWKDQGLVHTKVSESQLASNPAASVAKQLYTHYQNRLEQLNACDFGDLLLHNLTIFAKNAEILQSYTARFRYILVDEYQDTNIAQYLWLRLLACEHQNICCVGDDDQSIYSWRGAEVGNILKFEKDYENTIVIRLEQNYRSTNHILAAASALIGNNQGRYSKTLWTSAKDGEKLRIKSVWDDNEEARFVGEEIESRQRGANGQDKISLNEMAILVRAGFQTRSFEERLLTLGISYKVVGGLRFYERREIRDAVAYLRIALESRDDLAFERIINAPKRGIGKATIEKLHIFARANNCSLTESAKKQLELGYIKGKAKATLTEFLSLIDKWLHLSESLKPAELVEHILDESGYVNMWKQDKSPEAAGRLENIREFYRALAEFTTVAEFLEHISLVMDKDAEGYNSSEMLSIMTLHAAKGLEFDTVFLTGWEEGVFPHQRAIDESGHKGLEEERRLAYVGITRAKKLLYISHAANRRIYNQWQSSIPSRFLAELPASEIEQLEGGVHSSHRSSGPEMFQHKIDNIFGHNQPPTLAKKPQYNNKKTYNLNKTSHTGSSKGTLAGKKVSHIKFGEGKIISNHGSTLDIAFEKAGRKKIMKDFVQFI